MKEQAAPKYGATAALEGYTVAAREEKRKEKGQRQSFENGVKESSYLQWLSMQIDQYHFQQENREDRY